MKTKKLIQKALLSFVPAIIATTLFAQTPPVKQWDMRFGGSEADEMYAIQQTEDGGYILGGDSNSPADGDKTQNSQGSSDLWVVKTDAAGIKLWDKRFGGSLTENLYTVLQTYDGGYMLGGESKSGISGDKTQDSRGGLDYWIVKTNSSGVKQWDARFGGSNDDELRIVKQTSDGGYLLAGFSYSGISGDKSQASQGATDYWIVKTNSSGVKEWDARFGGTSNEELRAASQTTDGGYLLAGFSKSGIGGDKTIACKGITDYWIVKINSTGVKEWDADFGGNGNEYLYSIQQTSDEGYILGGYSDSDISGDVTKESRGGFDFWLVKVNGSGTKQWDARFGGSGYDKQKFVQQTFDGGYILAGWSDSGISGDKTQDNLGNGDYWIVKADAEGVKQWDARFGGSGDERLHATPQTSDGGYILGGYSYSDIGGDITQATQGINDYWIVKISGDTPLQSFYADADGDGFGNLLGDTLAFAQPPGFVANNTDCNDDPYSGAAIHPGMDDVCNGIDDNCNSVTDENMIAPATVTPAGAVSVCSGVLVTLTANYSAGVSYQWLKNGATISGATNQTYSTRKAGNYQVSEKNGYDCNAASAITSIATLPVPNATIVPLGNTNICLAGSVVLQANTGAGLSYQWQNGSNDITGATNQTYTATKAANYKVKITKTNNGCGDLSPALVVTQQCIEGRSMIVEAGNRCTLYPNPSTGKFTILLAEVPSSENVRKEENNIGTIDVMNVMGQVIYSEKFQVANDEISKEISMPAYQPSGIFLVKLRVADREYSAQLVYQKQ